MSNRRKRREPRGGMSPQRYEVLLIDNGTPPREAARAALFAATYGFDAMQKGPTGCIEFDVPSCMNIDCVYPAHQRFVADGS